MNNLGGLPVTTLKHVLYTLNQEAKQDTNGSICTLQQIKKYIKGISLAEKLKFSKNTKHQ